MDDALPNTLNVDGTSSLLNLAGGLSSSSGGASDLENEVLEEYERLLGNMNKLSSTLSTLSSGPVTLEIAEGLRLLERKVASVYTLMKASVYSIVLQQGEGETDVTGSEGGGGMEGDER